MMLFPIVIYDNKDIQLPDDDIFYIICKNGVYLKKSVGVVESIVPVKQISTLEDIQMMAKLHIEKIPTEIFSQAVNFFRAVYEEYRSEGALLIFYNKQRCEYKLVCPVQEVSYASISYKRGISIPGFDMIGTIHSHANFSAFHSSTDHSDEESFDGLHITVGYVASERISISCSLVVNGHRFITEPDEYIEYLERDEMPRHERRTTKKWDFKLKKFIDFEYTIETSKAEQTYFLVSKDVEFDKNWLKNVSKKSFSATASGATYGSWPYAGGSWYSGSRWNKSYTPMTRFNNVSGRYSPATKYEKVIGEVNKLAFKYDIKNKITSYLKQLLIEEIYEDDDSPYAYYRCTCGTEIIVDENKDEVICPKCKTDKHLTEVVDFIEDDADDDDELYDNENFHLVECGICGSSFTAEFADSGYCPFCGSDISDEVIPLLTMEDDIDQDLLIDSGEFLNPDIENVENIAREFSGRKGAKQKVKNRRKNNKWK